MYEQDKMLAQYMNDIRHYPLLTAEREQELAKIVHGENESVKNKQDAKQELIVSNLRLVVKIAIEIYNKVRGLGDMSMSLMDLVQAGNLGLMRSADLFLADHKDRFATYAYLTIKRRMIRAIKKSRFIHLPLNYFKYIHDIGEIENKHGETNDKELAKKLDIMVDTLSVVKRNRAPTISIEGMDDLLERYESGDTPLVDVVHKRDVKIYVFEKMKELKPRHRQVLFYKFFSNNNMTNTDIAKKIGITREAVRVIESVAIHKIRTKITEENMMSKIGNKNKKGGKNDNAKDK
jgi:RNA polymerase sigma factor (sigma-70 family)